MGQYGDQAGADAYRDWLQNGVRSRPVASPLFRLLAGLVSALFLVTCGFALWRLVEGRTALPSFDWSDVTAFVAMTVMFLVFATVAWFGSLPVWMWQLFVRTHGDEHDAGTEARAAPGSATQRWLQTGVLAPPSARPTFRVLAGLLTALFLLLAATWVWRLATGAIVRPDVSPFDLPLLLAFGLLFCLFGVVAVSGRAPLWIWRLYLRACGRL